jgi:DNA end-binding protein Ku
MAPRANWKGFLRLSLVTCPVALYPATSDSEKISFNQINRNTGHRIKYARVDADTGEEVASEDIMKGFKVDTDTYVEVTKEEIENVALESTRTIDIDEFVPRSDIDPRYIIRPYYVRPDGKVGHDAFAVIRETIREMNMVAIGRVVLTNREHIIALEPLDKGLMGTLLRYPYEVRSEGEYFDEIQDVKVTKDMLDLAKHIVNQKSGRFEPDKFEDQYEAALEQEARRPADHEEGPSRRRQHCRPYGGAAPERRPCSIGQAVETLEEAAQGGQRPEGNADADHRQEAGKGNREEDGVEAAAEVGLAIPRPPAGSSFIQRGSHETARHLPHGLQCGRSDAPQSLAPQGIGRGPVRAGSRRTRRRRLAGRSRHRTGVRQGQAVSRVDERDLSAQALVRATRRESVRRCARRSRQDRLGPFEHRRRSDRGRPV